MKTHLLLLLIAVVLIHCTKNEDILLDARAFQQRMKEAPNAVLLDVRTMEEVNEGRISEQINLDFKAPEFDLLIKGLDKSKTYFVYCASGIRSAKAADKMKAEGFDRVYLLEGGMQAWERAGLPVQK